MAPIISVEGLEKSYGDLEVIKGIDFSVEKGEVFAILGPNGTGKTTCVEILEGYRKANSGNLSVLGFEPDTNNQKFKERIGIVVQTSGVEEELTLMEALDLYASTYQNPKDSRELLEMVDLSKKADEQIKKLSGGQRRKLDLALGLVGNPDLIFLDEPTTGFSPEARHEAWDMISNLSSMGKTILLTSHYMEEVEYLADRMILLLDGKIVKEGRPQDLNQGFTKISFLIPGIWSEADLESMISGDFDSGGSEMSDLEIADGRAVIASKFPTKLLSTIIQKAASQDIELEGLSVKPQSLEDTYLEIIKNSNGTAQ